MVFGLALLLLSGVRAAEDEPVETGQEEPLAEGALVVHFVDGRYSSRVHPLGIHVSGGYYDRRSAGGLPSLLGVWKKTGSFGRVR